MWRHYEDHSNQNFSNTGTKDQTKVALRKLAHVHKGSHYLPWLLLLFPVFDKNLGHHNYTKRLVYIVTG